MTTDYRTTLRLAMRRGRELKRNPETRLWHWQAIESSVLDWRGSGWPTKVDACRSLAENPDWLSEMDEMDLP